MRTTPYVTLALLVAATAGVATARTTTGRLIGAVVDDGGAPLPGVTVTISSPALIGGAQTRATDGAGEFSFLSLLPGAYRVTAELPGFVSQERSQVRVPLGGAAALRLAMPAARFGDEITVTAETPVVDPTQVNAGQVFELRYLQSSAVGSGNRSYTTVVNQTAGVAGGGLWAGVPQPRVLGSTIGENAYFVDGVDSTNPVTATATAVLNFDAVAEIRLETAGFEAEHGRATGGILNLVTRSGGNQLSGTFDLRYRNDAFQESGDHFDAGELSSRHQVAGATLGGPILRDRVWFFASYQWLEDLFTPIGSPTTTEQEGQASLGKVTWQVGPGWRLAVRGMADRTTWDNWGASRWVMPEATGFKRGETGVSSAELTSVLSDSLLWTVTAGAYDYESTVRPQSGDLAAIGHSNSDTNLNTGNYGNQQSWDTTRVDLATDLTWFVDHSAGAHELKGGLEYSDLGFTSANCSTGTPGGERCVPGGSGFFFGDIETAGGTLPFLMYESATSGPTDYAGAVATAFLQDAWRPSPDLTLKLGLRYDAVTYDTNTGTRIADLGTLQPRLGVAWDLTGDATTVVRASWGRFMHPNMLTLPSNVRQLVEPVSIWYSCSGLLPLDLGIAVGSPEECRDFAAGMGWGWRLDPEGWDPYGWVLSPDEVYASEPNRADPGLRATYSDQLILAFERELDRQTSLELTFVDKKTRDVVDDTCNGNWPTAGADPACDFYVVGNIEGLERDFRGLTLTYETRAFPWLTLLASYTYSSSKGNLEYSQNQNGDVDVYPWHYDNISGYLSDHRRHRLKLNGYVSLKGDWTIAFDGRWSSPFTWTPVEDRYDNPEIPYGVHFLEPRGSREASSSHELDLQVSKGLTLGPTRLVLIGTVLNALGGEQPTAVCEAVRGCGDVAMGEPVDWQTPRRYEIGVRLEF